jgi:hypothetical protein
VSNRIAGLRDRIGKAAGRTMDVAESARRRWNVVDVAWTTQERDRRAVGSVLAGALAFRIFVYLLPLFQAVIVLIGLVAGFDDDGPRRLGSELGMSAYLADSVQSAARQSKVRLAGGGGGAAGLAVPARPADGRLGDVQCHALGAAPT